jgi:Uncharacterized protein conserved in bacteria (DUF2330)
MPARHFLALASTATALAAVLLATAAPACCPAWPPGKPVVNADQTVIMIWDSNAKTQHFIRQASFRSEAEDFGFIVPTPSQPELNESGNETFPYLLEITAPEIEKRTKPGSLGCGCGSTIMRQRLEAKKDASEPPSVRVLDEKLVAGFNASVLEASSANALVAWLKDNGYSFSPEIEAWAKPYVEAGWKFTALKVAKEKDNKEQKTVATSALRIAFKTDRPVFPYREPDSKSAAQTLNAKSRLLRIYFIAEAKYEGELTKETPWTGRVAWANQLKPEQRKGVLKHLKLPETTGPAQWWLTEFEDNWPYKVAPADLYFSRSADLRTIKRPPIIQYVASPWPTDVTTYAIAALVLVPVFLRRLRMGRLKSAG